MTVDISDFLSVLNAGTIAVVIVSGIGLSWIIGATVKVQGWRTIGLRYTFLGLGLFGPLTVVRYAESTTAWERVSSYFVLWAVYVATAIIVSVLRHRREGGKHG